MNTIHKSKLNIFITNKILYFVKRSYYVILWGLNLLIPELILVLVIIVILKTLDI